MIGDLPPSSSVTALTVPEASFITALPVPTEPVSETLRIAGWRVSSRPVAEWPCTTWKRPVGKPRVAIDLRELDGGERREARRLEDHRVAEGERGRRFPAGDLQRVVPRADAGGDAERLAARVAEGGRAEVDVLAGRALRERGEVLEALGARDHVDDARLLDRLAGVAGLERGERVVARAQDLRRAAQDARALGAGERGPGGLRRARRLHRGLDLGGAGHGKRGQAFAGRGVGGHEKFVSHAQFCETSVGCGGTRTCATDPLLNDHS